MVNHPRFQGQSPNGNNAIRVWKMMEPSSTTRSDSGHNNATAVSGLSVDFGSLPLEYQNVLRLAQEQHNLQVTPLEELKGGRTGARLYLVSVSTPVRDPVQHIVLKLDRVNSQVRSDETTRHGLALSQAPPGFARQHMVDLAFDRVERDGAIAVFYSIAGQSLHHFRPLAYYERQCQLQTIFSATSELLLTEWNAASTFDQAVHPQSLLARWLTYRLEPEGDIERFLQDVCHVRADTAGLLIQGHVFPNPLAYARQAERWGQIRSIDTLIGFQHGDLNMGNILVKFAANERDLAGYYLIDFALFREQIPLLYDQAYLEMSYLIRELSRAPFADWVGFVTHFAEQDIPPPDQVPVSLAGACAVVGAGRGTFDRWLHAAHPSLYDDLWGQYWLAAVAVGLNFCNKAPLSKQERMAGLIFAATHLQRYCTRFGAQMPTEIAHLYHASPSDAAPPLGSTPPPHTPTSHNLPLEPTPLIGREQEVAEVYNALVRDEVRLLTLTGLGGTGKTRLALQVATELLDHFQHGVFFVSLADITAPELVVSEIAQPLGIREGGCQPLLEKLKDYLQDRHVLLLLDNFEHVVAAAPVVADLLAAAPRLTVLVTSRERLNLRGEHGFPVPPLKLPDPLQLPPLERLGEYEAIKLFVERARAANACFTLTAENASAVAEICHRLDGIPLAIELAASRMRVLTAEEIAVRLNDRFRLLVNGSRSALPRQQTLQALIDWSHDLLSENERVLLRRLAIFAGGWTLQAAEEVCSGEGIEAWEVLDLLAHLIDKSLVIAEPQDGGQRYRFLETLREYGQERLAESKETDVFAHRHAEYFMKLAGESYGELWGPQQGYQLTRLEMEHDNLRTALEWMARAAGHEEMLLQLSGTLWRFWEIRGYISEGRAWLERALARNPNAPAYLRANGLRGAGMLARQQGDYAQAKAMHEQSLALFQELDYKFSVARELDVLGEIEQSLGNYPQAIELHQKSLALRCEIGDEEGIAVSLGQLGRIARRRGQYQLARDLLEESLELHRQQGDKLYTALSLNNLGRVACLLCEYERAISLLEEALSLYRELNDRLGISNALHNLGNVAQEQGDMQRAKTLYQESLALKQELGHRRGIARVMADLAEAAWCQGDYTRAEELAGQSLTLFQELDVKPGVIVSSVLLALVAHYQGDFERAASLATAGLALSTELDVPRGVAYAQEVLGLIAYAQGNLQEAQVQFQNALAGFRKVDDKRNVAYTLVNLARTVYRQGDRACAIRFLDESLSISRELDIRWSLAFTLEIMGLLQRSQGNYDRAAELLRESLHLSAEQANRQGIANCLGALAGLAALARQPIRAAHLFAAADRLRQEIGVKMGSDDQQEYEYHQAALRRQLDDTAFTTAWSEGWAMTTEQAIEEAYKSVRSERYAINLPAFTAPAFTRPRQTDRISNAAVGGSSDSKAWR
jgi:predicted ATPase/Tfp pilus assembly protein PilF